MKILVTGGAGYIGSHTCVELINAGHDVLVIDNLSNSSEKSLDRVKLITNHDLAFKRADIRNFQDMTEIFETFRPQAIIHFAGLKAVGESVSEPVEYYDNNVAGTLSLLRAMDKSDCKNIVFSSSATVYGEPQYLPFDEAHPVSPINPYGRTKLMVEEILGDWVNCGEGRSAVCLRYFNPVGAHQSGRIGEDPQDIPNNLMPYIAQTAVGRREKLHIFGDDYETRDGTGERDFIHVVDLARAHLAAVENLDRIKGKEVINVGTGNSATVLELVKAFEKASGRKITYEIAPRRAGDVAQSWADCSNAKDKLDWSAEHSIDDMCRDTWNWQSSNPEGYK